MKTQRGDGMLGFCPHLVQLRQQGWQLYKSAALYSPENSLVLILLEAAVDPRTTECGWIETGQLTISNDPTRYQTKLSHNMLHAFTKLQKATISFVMYVYMSAENNLAPTGQIFMKFDT